MESNGRRERERDGEKMREKEGGSIARDTSVVGIEQCSFCVD